VSATGLVSSRLVLSSDLIPIELGAQSMFSLFQKVFTVSVSFADCTDIRLLLSSAVNEVSVPHLYLTVSAVPATDDVRF